MKNTVAALLAFAATACGVEDDVLIPFSTPLEGFVGSCQVVCDYSVTPTALKVRTTPGNVFSCEDCRDLLRYHFFDDQCEEATTTIDYTIPECE